MSKNESAKQAEILFHQAKGQRPVVEIQVPIGTTLDVSRKLESLVYEKLIPELGLSPCPNCRSGLDLFIKERFDSLVRVDLDSLQIIR